MSSPNSWGRINRFSQQTKPIWWRDQEVSSESFKILPYGLGRSYGDVCLNEGNLLIPTSFLDRFLSFDQSSGIVRCEAGVTIKELISVFLPRGWFPSVVPGTQYVTIGGAIANDIHGKNHHVAGSFGCFVKKIALKRSDGEVLICSEQENHELFQATIGGLGLSGLILWADLELLPVASSQIEMESIKFNNLDEFFEVSKETSNEFPYTVAWLDCVSKGDKFGRGIFMRGKHASKEQSSKLEVRRPTLFDKVKQVPFELPICPLNNFTVSAFNNCYYFWQREKEVSKQINYEKFFFPLDAINHWNRIYGRKGFYQFQCVVPFKRGSSTGEKVGIIQVLEEVVRSGEASFLAVLKEFGDIPSPGLLSFPREGLTLCLDLPNRGEKTLALLARLEQMVVEQDGALYPGKDGCMKPESFKKFFPLWKEFSKHIDPNFSSSFWRRVTKD